MMVNLATSPADMDKKCLQLTYFSRLEAWRQTVMARNDAIMENEALEGDEMLARLIAREEELLWENKQSPREQTLSKATRALLVIGQATVAFVAATVASMAFRAMVRR